MPTQEAVIKSIPAQPVAPVRNTLAKLSGIGEPFSLASRSPMLGGTGGSRRPSHLYLIRHGVPRV
jgi:hypothetical protein